MMRKMRLTTLCILCIAFLTTVSAFSAVSTGTKSTLSSPLFSNNVPFTMRTKELRSSITVNGGTAPVLMSPLSSALTRIGLMSFIIGMCIALPATLIPQQLLYKAKIINKVQSEKAALWTGQFCARWLVRLIPFVNIDIIPHHDSDPEPSIWVCNHISMLDVFMLLATDLRLRGGKKRPIKIVYWKQLEDNPVTKLLFRQCGFIPVSMVDNGNGNKNEYDMSSFRTLLKETKKAFAEGFDIGILPEGQLNPNPESGLLPLFSGAYTLARMSKRPINIMALHGIGKLWHPVNGLECTSRKIKVRAYPHGRHYSSNDEFVETFSNVVGHFGQTGEDIDDLQEWLDGSKWQEKVKESTL